MAALQRLVHDHGMTVLLAEHRLERVAGWVDVAIGFDRGRVSSGSPADVIGHLAAGPPVRPPRADARVASAPADRARGAAAASAGPARCCRRPLPPTTATEMGRWSRRSGASARPTAKRRCFATSISMCTRARSSR